MKDIVFEDWDLVNKMTAEQIDKIYGWVHKMFCPRIIESYGISSREKIAIINEILREYYKVIGNDLKYMVLMETGMILPHILYE